MSTNIDYHIDYLRFSNCSEINGIINTLKRKGILKLCSDSEERRRILANLIRVFKYHPKYVTKNIYNGKKIYMQRFLSCRRPYGFEIYYLYFNRWEEKFYLIVQRYYISYSTDYNTYDIYEFE